MLAWLATTDLPWRPAVEFGAIDMSPSYKAAVRTGLPHATGVVDHLHVMQLANKMLNQVRHRLTSSHRGRRGRACDPAWKARRKLLRNREDLDPEQFAAMWNPLWAEGPIGQALLVAWIAKENLRFPARAGPHRPRPAPDRPREVAVPDLVRGLRPARGPPARPHHRPLVRARSKPSSTPASATPRAKGSTA